MCSLKPAFCGVSGRGWLVLLQHKLWLQHRGRNYWWNSTFFQLILEFRRIMFYWHVFVFQTASDMLVFLLRWFDKFPELKARHFFLTGESYAGVFYGFDFIRNYFILFLLFCWLTLLLAGHYIPQLADAIQSYNRQSSGFKINIQGIAVSRRIF